MPEDQVLNGQLESELTGSAPHISDYWQVITRRLWLVVLIFGVTTASAIWAVSQQRMVYETTASLQINDPLEVTRQLTSASRLAGINIYVDPIESEVQVLSSVQVARRVVTDLGMRLRPVDVNLVRSDLFFSAQVDPATPDGSFQLAYDEARTWVQLFDASGMEIAAGPVGNILDAGSMRLTTAPSTRCFDGIYLDWVEGYDDDDVAARAAAESMDAGSELIDPAAEMIDFIEEMKAKAQTIKSDFLVIAQNAPYLLDTDPARYASIIDAIATEDTWFFGEGDVGWDDAGAGDLTGGDRHSDDYSTANRIAQNKKYLDVGIPVFTVDYCISQSNADQVYLDSRSHGFIPLVTRVPLSQITETPPF